MNPNKLDINNFELNNGEYTTKFAYLFALYLNNLSRNIFSAIIENLILDENIRKYAIYIYIDIFQLNGRYGEILDRIKLIPAVSKEEKLFLNLISNLKTFLNTGISKELPPIEIDQFVDLPDVLKGRYFGYQLMYSVSTNNKELEEKYWNLFFENILPKTDLRQYLHEFINHLLMIKSFDKLEFILTNYYESIFDLYHVHSYLDMFIFNYIDVVLSIKTNEIKRANIVFQNLDIRKIQTDSYCDYYLVFYNIVGYHLEQDSKKKLKFKKTYLTLAKKSKFKFFSIPYLENYFA